MTYYSEFEICSAREALEDAGIDPDSMSGIAQIEDCKVVKGLARLLVNDSKSHEDHMGRPFVTAGGSVIRRWPCVAVVYSEANRGDYYRTRMGIALVVNQDERGICFDVSMIG